MLKKKYIQKYVLAEQFSMPEGFLKERGSLTSETHFAINFPLTKGGPLLTIFRKN